MKKGLSIAAIVGGVALSGLGIFGLVKTCHEEDDDLVLEVVDDADDVAAEE